MGIAFEHGAVHKSPGVALVGVAYNEFLVGLLISGELPLTSGGESAASASAQPGSGYGIDNLLRSHSGNSFAESAVTAVSDILLNFFGVQASGIAQNDTSLNFAFGRCFEFGVVPVAWNDIAFGGLSGAT